MSKKYPIRPSDIDTSAEPRGFDTLLNYGQRCMLWGFFQYWKAQRDWRPLTHAEYQDFIPRMGLDSNTYMTCAVIKFVGPRLESLLDVRKGEDGRVITYAPTHFLIATYFLWNPAEGAFK